MDPLHCHQVSTVGKYLLLQEIDSTADLHIHKAIDVDNKHGLEEYMCAVIPIHNYRNILAAYWRVNSHEHVSGIEEILLGDTQAYVFFSPKYGDLHGYLRTKRKLDEAEAGGLFRQILSAVAHCHENGIILHSLKLRKFAFVDPEQTILQLEGLEDACILDHSAHDDYMNDRHGCPAYVSPEILQSNTTYSGRAADMWSLGVMLYTLLVGRYPFYHTDVTKLFRKIRQGQYKMPHFLSSHACCLIRGLLRIDASERFTAEEALEHPWFTVCTDVVHMNRKGAEKDGNQIVPGVILGNCKGTDRDGDQMVP